MLNFFRQVFTKTIACPALNNQFRIDRFRNVLAITVIKNLAGDDVAVINSEEKLSFVSGTTPLVKQEVKDFLNEHDIAYFL